jgi:predicted deacylase
MAAPKSSRDRAERDGFPRTSCGRIVVKQLGRAAPRGEERRIELVPPDLAAYAAGNTGIPYAWRFDGARPGPNLMINALTHGNELCGAIAVDFLFREAVRPVRGSLTLSFANVAAYRQFDVREPDASRYVDEDFNRVWDTAALEGARSSVERARARLLRPLLDQTDFLLDLHSMQTETEPLALAGTRAKGRDLARRVGIPEIVVLDHGHAAGRRMRDYGCFDDPDSPKAALLVECGQHWLKPSADLAIEASLRFLAAFELVDPGWLARHLPAAAPPAQKLVEVTEVITVASDRFHFVESYCGLEVIPKQGTIIAHDGDLPIATPYDECVLIMPSRRLARGQTAVRLGRIL